MVFVQMEEHSQSRWDAWHAFIHRWVSQARCKLHVSLHVTHVALAPQRGIHRGDCPLVCH